MRQREPGMIDIEMSYSMQVSKMMDRENRINSRWNRMEWGSHDFSPPG